MVFQFSDDFPDKAKYYQELASDQKTKDKQIKNVFVQILYRKFA